MWRNLRLGAKFANLKIIKIEKKNLYKIITPLIQVQFGQLSKSPIFWDLDSIKSAQWSENYDDPSSDKILFIQSRHPFCTVKINEGSCRCKPKLRHDTDWWVYGRVFRFYTASYCVCHYEIFKLELYDASRCFHAFSRDNFEHESILQCLLLNLNVRRYNCSWL